MLVYASERRSASPRGPCYMLVHCKRSKSPDYAMQPSTVTLMPHAGTQLKDGDQALFGHLPEMHEFRQKQLPTQRMQTGGKHSKQSFAVRS